MRRRLILLVEDNEDDEIMTVDALRSATAPVEIAVVRDGAEALDWLFARGPYSARSASVAPDVVLLDIRLPKLSGLDVLAAIRASPATATLPVVMLTSSSEDIDLERAYRLGANSYVRKPVSYEDFMRVVSHLGQYWTGCNETIVRDRGEL